MTETTTEPLPPGSVTGISLTFYRASLHTGVKPVMPIVTMFVPAFVVWYMSRMCVKHFRKYDGTAETVQEEAQPETDAPLLRNIPVELN